MLRAIVVSPIRLAFDLSRPNLRRLSLPTKSAFRTVNHLASLVVHLSTSRMAQQRVCVANLSRSLRTAGLPHSTSRTSRNTSQVLSRTCQQSRKLSTTSPRLAQFKTVEKAKAFNNMGVSFPRVSRDVVRTDSNILSISHFPLLLESSSWRVVEA